MCKSKFLENIHEISICNVTTPILECIFACKYFKKLEILIISGVFKCKVLEKLLTKSNTFINNLKHLEIRHNNNDEKLIETVKKCANQTNSPVLYYSVYLCDLDKEYLYKSAEMNFISAIQIIYLDYTEDSNEQLKWLLKGSEMGDFYSQIQLCKYYVERNDNSNAIKWFLLAEKNNRYQVSFFAMKFGLDLLGKNEIEKAMEWLLISAERGNSKAQCYLAYCYGLAKDYKKEFEWYFKSATNGYADGQFHLGQCYAKGQGIEKDLTKAFEWYLKSAEQENENAQFLVGQYYEQGIGVEQDVKKSFEWTLKSAKQDCDHAQLVVGNYYADGFGTEIDLKKSFKWYMKLAEKGNTDAQFNIGYCYEQGKGIEKDLKEAFEWYLISAEYNVDAQYNIGHIYMNGEGIEKDLNKAFEWFLKAATHDDIDSQYQVGYMYCNGLGIQPDMHEALKWLMKSSREKVQSRAIIEFMYSYGLLNHLKAMNDLDEPILNELSNVSEGMPIDKDFISNANCDICSEKCTGFYYSTVDESAKSFDVCMKCWNKDAINERLMEFKSEIGERRIAKTHFLCHFFNLIEFFKQENENDNPQLNAIILQLLELKKAQ